MAEKVTVLAAWRDEKARIARGDEGTTDGHRGRVRRRDPCRAAALALLLVLLGFGGMRVLSRSFVRQPVYIHTDCEVPPEEPRMVDDFKQITPSEKLEWHPCFTSFQCARLTVPMDYNRPLDAFNTKDSPKVHLALLMVPGRNHTATGKYSTSPLLLNPGGPGGSGVKFAAGIGFGLQAVVGEDQDIIGFDPRGISETTPLVDCWAFPENNSFKNGMDDSGPSQDDIRRGWFHRIAWVFTGWEILMVNSTKESFNKLNRRSRLVGDLCATNDALYGNDSILQHVSTPAVARDMLSIIDAWDAWKGKQEKNKDEQVLDTAQSSTRFEEDSKLDTKGKLVYWGFSYGTLLGATFAAMFPDRVGRVILDGVVDADYYVSPIWHGSLYDADAVEASFFKYCHKAGTRCAIFRDGDSEADIRTRVYHIAHKLKDSPIHAINPQTHAPTVLPYELLKYIMFMSLYFPSVTFPPTALALDLFYREDVAALTNVFITPTSYDPQPYCAGYIPPQYQQEDIRNAIMCSDKRNPLNYTLHHLQTSFEELTNISSYADIWMTLMIGCSGWSIKATDPPMRWDDQPAHRQKPIKTSFPLLFLSNTLDPVTPLRAGVKMARKFVDAGLVEQLSEGHCTLSARSLCTMKKVREYLLEGKVPPTPKWGPKGREVEDGKWERCESNDWPWMPPNSNPEHQRPLFPSELGDDGSGVVAEGAHLMEAWGQVSEFASQMTFWGMQDVGIQLNWEMLRQLEELRLVDVQKATPRK